MSKIALVLLPPFWPNTPPIALASLKGFLAGQGIIARTFDYNNRFFSRVPERLKKEWLKSCNTFLEENIFSLMREHAPEEFKNMLDELLSYEIIGFSCYKSNFDITIKIARLLKQKNEKIKIIFGGPEISRSYFKTKENFYSATRGVADFLAAGEGEKPLLDYILDKTTGNTALFDELETLNNIPIPDYSDFDFKDYPRGDTVSLMFSRGCPRKCAFCAEKFLYKKLRFFPADRIIEEIHFHKARGISNFIFHDSLINADFKKLEELLDKIIAEFGSIKWSGQIAVRKTMPEELFAKIKRSGAYHLFVGLETGSNRTLARMNKGFTQEDALLFFKKLTAHGISFGVSLITGYPGETNEDFKESLEFLIKNKQFIPKIEQVNPFVYYDGISLPEDADYKKCEDAVRRAREFISVLKKEGFKITNAFTLNLVEEKWK
ncbi:radical SAM domain-containing protein [Candidatus Omnitrophus magneticus]|uniref:Radical SAM domain-containing protein n=1 Tax=Candidatus Omnitrophus magneticus TaxID=1609969 RepID=A0A0F0CRP4_9BACT|nr:radical SAM domain-containing protein [Candidatus Omnitrophus magneticus]